jgi:hypothetical protein
MLSNKYTGPGMSKNELGSNEGGHSSITSSADYQGQQLVFETKLV